MFKRIFSSIPGLIVIASFAAAAMKVPAFARGERLEISDARHQEVFLKTTNLPPHERISAVGRSNRGSREETLARGFSAKSGELLDVDLETGGEIDVTGWDKDSVHIVATLDASECSHTRVSFDETSDGLRVSSENTRSRSNRRNRNNSCDTDLVIQVPQKQQLRFRTMGGDIRVDNVEGDISGKTMGGKLDLSNLKGNLSLTTMGGNITLVKSRVDGSVKTMGGKVLLEDVTGSVKGHSMGGSVVYRRVTNKKGLSSGDEVRIKTMGGDINVDEAPGGADVHTMGGKIRINSAAKFVKALTMGGEIEIREVDGSVNATTMGGDISVTMTGDPKKGDRAVSLRSYGGDITLVVPDGLSMDIDIELSYTRNHEDDYTITSDFPMAQRESREWIRGKGDPRKVIFGSGAVNGGQHKIRIETINGNVYLKKSSKRG